MTQVTFKGMTALLLVSILACSPTFTDTEYLEKAKIHVEKMDLNSAIIELKNALTENSGNYEARLLLGEIYLKTGNTPAAEAELRKAQNLSSPADLTIPLLARVLERQGKHDEVASLSILGLSESAHANLLTSKALANMATNRLDIATEQIDEAISKAPHSSYTLTTKARFLALSGELEAARGKIDLVLNDDPEYAPAYSLLGDIERSLTNWALAEEAYTKAVKYATHNHSDLLKLVQIKILSKKYDDALPDIEKLIRVSPQNPVANYALGLVKYHQGDYQAAVNALGVIPKNQHPLSHFYLASAHYQLNNLLQAETFASSFHVLMPSHIGGRRLLATIKLINKQYSEAEQLIRPLISTNNEDTAALNLLANALLKQGKSEEAVKLLERVAELNPDSSSSKIRLGVGLLAKGDNTASIAQIESALALSSSKNSQAYAMLVLNHLQKSEFDQAIKAAKDFRNEAPESVAPYNLLGKVYLVIGEQNKALEAFTKALEIKPANPIAAGHLIDIAIKERDLIKARELCNSVLEVYENHLATMLKLASVDLLQEDEKSMVARLEAAMNTHPAALEPRIKLARYHIAKGSPEKALFILSELTQNADAEPVLLETLAMAQLAQRDFISAKEKLLKLLTKKPDSDKAYYFLSLAYSGLKDQKNMEKALNETLALAPNHFKANFDLTKIYLSRNEFERVEKQLIILSKAAPGHLDVLRLEATSQKKQGNHAKALEIYQKMFDAKPTTEAVLLLAGQKTRMADLEGAQRLQEMWVTAHGGDIGARFALAGTYTRLNQPDKANQQFEQIIEIDKDNVIALNNLAWNYRLSDPSKALQYAKKASDLKPDAHNILDTLAVVQLHNGDLKMAKRNIERALDISPNNPGTLYHSALISKALGNRESARNILEFLLAKGGAFRKRDDAIKLLEEIRQEND